MIKKNGPSIRCVSVFALFFMLSPVPRAGFAEEAGKSVEEQRRDTIRYGTESEIASLIQSLKSENADYLDDELAVLVQRTLNRSVLTGIFEFFAEREKGGLEERALRALAEWDNEANETVIAAINYLGSVKSAGAVRELEALIGQEDTRFRPQAFRALGRIAGGNGTLRDEITAYLMDYYTARMPPDDIRREIVSALGAARSTDAVSFLSRLAENSDERLTIRIAAVESLSAIGDGGGLDAILEGISARDPNLRAASIAALGPFSGDTVDNAILEAFRDSYYRTRTGAAEAAGKRKMAAAIPYLEYRARNDDIPGVKDAAIRALGDIGNSAALSVLDSLFGERRNADRVRILAAEMLIREDAGRYAGKLIAELDEAKRGNQTALYNGFLRVISSARTGEMEALAERLLALGGVIEKSYALDIINSNRFTRLIPQVELLADPKNGTISRKAQGILENLRRQ
ncbi:MAG: HEAT repeat domain-containing protein [Spirochaetaceae bacterium]|jgi:HEAT repeat protein|nr:HEAT repeat domain-containing protein [Spirochaetaceae bacterium]